MDYIYNVQKSKMDYLNLKSKLNYSKLRYGSPLSREVESIRKNVS